MQGKASSESMQRRLLDAIVNSMPNDGPGGNHGGAGGAAGAFLMQEGNEGLFQQRAGGTHHLGSKGLNAMERKPPPHHHRPAQVRHVAKHSMPTQDSHSRQASLSDVGSTNSGSMTPRQSCAPHHRSPPWQTEGQSNMAEAKAQHLPSISGSKDRVTKNGQDTTPMTPQYTPSYPSPSPSPAHGLSSVPEPVHGPPLVPAPAPDSGPPSVPALAHGPLPVPVATPVASPVPASAHALVPPQLTPSPSTPAPPSLTVSADIVDHAPQSVSSSSPVPTSTDNESD